MKAIICSLLSLLLLFLAVTGAALTIEHKMDALIDEITDADGKENATALYESYKGDRWLLSVCVADGLIFDLENAFGEWCDSLNAGLPEEAEIAKSRLIRNLSHIKRLSGFNLKAIL